MPTFTPQEREQLRATLVSTAEADARIIAAAHTGSGAAESVDCWSDIDLALCLAPTTTLEEVLSDWTKLMYNENRVAAHHDVRYGSAVFRVFLLKNTLQVDLAFWPSKDFRALGPNFRLIFGKANESSPVARLDPKELIGMAWLYALHVRSSIARGRVWQSEFMLSGLRDQVLALACLRHNLPAHQGRGLDDLPPQLKQATTDCLIRSLDVAELKRAFGTTIDALRSEIEIVDSELARSLSEPLRTLLTSIESSTSE